MSNLINEILQLVRQRWWLGGLFVSVVGLAVASVRAFESEASRQRRADRRKKKDLRILADSISAYAKRVREEFPNGAVVVSEEDLAAKMRKRHDFVVTALNVLLKEEKVQRTQLNGYWRLNA